MKRQYYSSTSETPPSPPSAPATGYPTYGSPSGGVAPTTPGPHWFHMITEELQTVIEVSGQTPDAANLDQLLEAIKRSGAAHVTSTTASSTTLNLSNTGMVLVNASSGNITVHLPAASDLAHAEYQLVRTDSSANTVTIAADGSDSVEGLSSRSLPIGARFTLVSDGVSAWRWPHSDPTPAGVVAYSAALNVPDGWLECNGGDILRSAYPRLFAAIGTHYGVGDGTTTFGLPDLRGEFIRALDSGRLIDPEPARELGSAQTDAFGAHNHMSGFVGTYRGNSTGVSGGLIKVGTTDLTITSVSPDSFPDAGGSETRPRNVALMAIIRF